MLFFSLPLLCDEVPSGPLRGKLLDAPHQIYYCFPGFSARDGLDDSLRVRTQAYYVNEFRGYAFDPDDEILDSDGRFADTARAKELSAMDYESLVLEGEVSAHLGRNHRLGAVVRVYGYYGGVLDPLIEQFHGLFGFANASREYYPEGLTTVSVQNDRGVKIELDGPALLLGDIDVYGVWTLAGRPETALALAWAVELPTGQPGTPAGNGYPDAGLQILFEKRFGPAFALHFQQGVVVPGELIFPGAEANPLPISQTLAALEWHPVPLWSLILQTRIHTSPITSKAPLDHSLFPWADQFELPVTSLLIGARRGFRDWVLQFYIEEDTLTYEGPDILVSVSAEWKIR